MLAYVGEGRSKCAVVFQDFFDVSDHIRLVDEMYVSAGGGVNADSDLLPERLAGDDKRLAATQDGE